ncbi:MAG: alpha/beta fold hydrolase [Deltaproteobacteria bacterium]|nr:alpha/beta fold hydrolase [Deltaproteobacteria bacterium]MBW2417740.1 alpha/beta fold hydrolase [Deltaproteobacteria bacterium]
MQAFQQRSVNGIDLAYVDHAPRQKAPRQKEPALLTGDGLPLVLVHGFTGHRDDFAGVLPALARHRRCLAPDLRGHGDSDRAADPSDYDFETLEEDLVGLLDALGIEVCHLLGHSMGGMVALRFTLAHPARVASLVLMNTSAAAPEGYSREGLEAASALARAQGMQELQRRVEAGAKETELKETALKETAAEGTELDESYWPHHRRRYAAMDPEAYGALVAAMLDQQSLETRLGEIACPTLVLVGAADGAFVPAAATLAAGIPGARHVVIPGAAHHPHREKRDEWLAAMEAHFAAMHGG